MTSYEVWLPYPLGGVYTSEMRTFTQTMHPRQQTEHIYVKLREFGRRKIQEILETVQQ